MRPPTGRRENRDWSREIEDEFTQAIARGQADGSIANRQEPRILAHFLLVGLQGLEVMLRAKCERARLDNTVSVMVAVLD